MLKHDNSQNVLTLNKAKNAWRKTTEFKSNPAYQVTMDKLRSWFLPIEWEVTPVREVDAYFLSILERKHLDYKDRSKLKTGVDDLLVILEFIDFINYLNYKHGNEPMLGKTRVGINRMLAMAGNKKEESNGD